MATPGQNGGSGISGPVCYWRRYTSIQATAQNSGPIVFSCVAAITFTWSKHL